MDAYRTVLDCDDLRRRCEASHRTTGRWLVGLICGVVVSAVVTAVAWGAHVSATNSRQDAEISSLNKNQDRILDKLDQIENLIRNGGR